MSKEAKVAAGAVDDGIVAAVAVGGVAMVDFLAGGDVDGTIRRKWWKRNEFDYLLEWWASLSCCKDRRRENE